MSGHTGKRSCGQKRLCFHVLSWTISRSPAWAAACDKERKSQDNRPGRTAKEKGCYPVLFLIDEAGRAAIPKLYEYAVTVVGRQISLWIAMQSIVQLEAIYGWAHAQELLENLDTKIWYRQGQVTAEYLEKELGEKSEFSRS